MTRRPPKTSPLGRLFELGSLAARAGASTVASRLSGIGRSAPAREALRTADLVKNAHRLVATLGELKGAAMKVGQMLSLQDAFLPPEVAVVLRSLQGETPSLPLSMVEDQLAEELGDPLQIFASFEPEAFAAASIGQVHRAVLRDGRHVAVKIQYPNIDRIVEADLGNLYRVLKSVVALVSKVDFEPIWKELRARLREELDYLHEAERMRRMTELHAGVPEIVIPQVIEEASTTRILTTTYEEGLSPDEACSAATPQELKDRWGLVLFDFLLRGLLEHRLLHADPNLANFAFRRDGRVVVYRLRLHQGGASPARARLPRHVPHGARRADRRASRASEEDGSAPGGRPTRSTSPSSSPGPRSSWSSSVPPRPTASAWTTPSRPGCSTRPAAASPRRGTSASRPTSSSSTGRSAATSGT